jgi:predicted TIM-barrel fold metal-dependent hydrolase
MTRREFNGKLLAWGTAATLPQMLWATDRKSPSSPITAVDTHAHIFRRDLKMVEGRRYTPDYDAPLAGYLRLLDTHGVSHGVLVQPSFLGTDNSFMVDALRQYPERLRGIAVVAPEMPVAALEELAAAGVAGIRLNLFGAAALPDFNKSPWPAFLGHVARLGWQVEVHKEARDLPALIGPLLAAGVNVVVDHFGRPEPTLGIEDPGFRYLLTTAGTRRVWVKVSGAYRNGTSGRGDAVAHAAIPLLREAFGLERLLWGSDWPHTQFERQVDYSAARNQFDTWFTDPAERKVILSETPAQLFRFVRTPESKAKQAPA